MLKIFLNAKQKIGLENSLPLLRNCKKKKTVRFHSVMNSMTSMFYSKSKSVQLRMNLVNLKVRRILMELDGF